MRRGSWRWAGATFYSLVFIKDNWATLSTTVFDESTDIGQSARQTSQEHPTGPAQKTASQAIGPTVEGHGHSSATPKYTCSGEAEEREHGLSSPFLGGAVAASDGVSLWAQPYRPLGQDTDSSSGWRLS